MIFPLSQVKLPGYKQQRGASKGASITLVAGCGVFTALFECATKVAGILGDRGLTELSDGLIDYVPQFSIPVEDLHSVLQKLSKKYSIALVEYTAEARYVLLWKIEQAQTQTPQPPSTNLDDY